MSRAGATRRRSDRVRCRAWASVASRPGRAGRRTSRSRAAPRASRRPLTASASSSPRTLASHPVVLTVARPRPTGRAAPRARGTPQRRGALGARPVQPRPGPRSRPSAPDRAGGAGHSSTARSFQAPGSHANGGQNRSCVVGNRRLGTRRADCGRGDRSEPRRALRARFDAAGLSRREPRRAARQRSGVAEGLRRARRLGGRGAPRGRLGHAAGRPGSRAQTSSRSMYGPNSASTHSRPSLRYSRSVPRMRSAIDTGRSSAAAR